MTRSTDVIDELIRVYANSTPTGYQLYAEDLPDHEINKLMIELFFEDDCFDCLYDEFDSIKTLVADFLLKESVESKKDLAVGIRDAMWGHYKKVIQSLIDNRISYVSAEDLESYGYVPSQCNQTGETLWR